MKKHKTIEEEIGEKRLIINGINQNPEITVRIEPYGYIAEKRQEGMDLLTAAEQSVQMQKVEYSEQYVASNAFQEARTIAEADLNRLRKICKHEFQDNTDAWQLLRLGEIPPRNFEQWMTYSEYFYTTLLNNESLQTPLLRFGCTVENITADYDSSKDLNNLRQSMKTETGDAQRATKLRDEKLDALKTYTDDLVFILKLAFEGDDAQLLEKLGITVYS